MAPFSSRRRSWKDDKIGEPYMAGSGNGYHEVDWNLESTAGARTAPKLKDSHQRFLIWVAYFRKQNSTIDVEHQRTCPVLQCGRKFNNSEEMQQHVCKCPYLQNGTYWCCDCHKEQRISRYHINGCHEPHARFAKVRSSVKLATKKLFSIGSPAIGPSVKPIMDKEHVYDDIGMAEIASSDSMFTMHMHELPGRDSHGSYWSKSAYELSSTTQTFVPELASGSMRSELNAGNEFEFVSRAEPQELSATSLNGAGNSVHIQDLGKSLPSENHEEHASLNTFLGYRPTRVDSFQEAQYQRSQGSENLQFVAIAMPGGPKHYSNSHSWGRGYPNDNLVSPMSSYSSTDLSTRYSTFSSLQSMSTGKTSMSSFSSQSASSGDYQHQAPPSFLYEQDRLCDEPEMDEDLSIFDNRATSQATDQSPLLDKCVNPTALSIYPRYDTSRQIIQSSFQTEQSEPAFLAIQIEATPSMDQSPQLPHLPPTLPPTRPARTRISGSDIELRCSCGYTPLGKPENRKANLTRHVKTCTRSIPHAARIKNHRCNYPGCQKRFTRIDALRVHQGKKGHHARMELDGTSISPTRKSEAVRRLLLQSARHLGDLENLDYGITMPESAEKGLEAPQ